MGSVVPVGEFKSIDNGAFDAGFAETGFTLSFDGDYYLHNRFAVTGRFYFGMSGINEAESYQWLKNNLGSYFIEDSVRTTIGFWQWSAPMVGMKYNYPVVLNKLYIETGIFSGLNITPIPALQMKVIDDTNKRIVYSENILKNSFSVPLMADAAIRIIFNQNMQLKLHAGYYQAKTKHQHVSYYLNENAETITEELSKTDFNVPIKAINLGVGFIYTL